MESLSFALQDVLNVRIAFARNAIKDTYLIPIQIPALFVEWTASLVVPQILIFATLAHQAHIWQAQLVRLVSHHATLVMELQPVVLIVFLVNFTVLRQEHVLIVKEIV